MAALPGDGRRQDGARGDAQNSRAYALEGVPEELVTAAKRREVADAEFERNSIPGLANVWSNAIAAEGRASPDEDVEAIQRVTVADVNRVARRYLAAASSITATLKSVPSGQPVATKGFGGAEQVTAPPTSPVRLPPWASADLARLDVPSEPLDVSDATLPNGLRLIVRTDRTSPTISVSGSVKHDFGLQTPPGKEGVSDLLSSLFSYGTQTLDRLAFSKALDDIAANETAGYSFSMTVLKADFSRGVELLADNELRPALPATAFAVVKQQTAQFVAGNLQSPEYRTHRALDVALLPPADPVLRQATPETHRAAHACGRQGVSRRNHPSRSHHDRGDRRYQRAGSARRDRAMVRDVARDRPQARHDARRGASQRSVRGGRGRCRGGAGHGLPRRAIAADPLRSGLLSPRARHPCAGGGFYATRLYHDLRQIAGYVYTVDVRLDASKTRSTYEVTYGCDPDNVSRARALIERDLDQMRTQEVSEDELHQAKALLLREIVLNESSEEAVAHGLLARAELGLPLDEPLIASRKFYALTAPEVRAAFDRAIRPHGWVQVVRGPAPH